MKQEKPEYTDDIVALSLDVIYPNPHNPWDAKRDDEDMHTLMASIMQRGLLRPILVRNRPGGGYELLSGHRRVEAFRQLDFCEIPACIRDCGEEEGIQILLDSNKYRTKSSLREQCRAVELEYRLHKHQGQRGDPDGQTNPTSLDEIAKIMGKSPSTVSRLLRLNKLSDPFFEMIEKRKLTLQAALQLAALDSNSQKELLLYMKERDGYYPNAKEARMLAEAAKEKELTLEDLYNILGPAAQPQEKLPDEPEKKSASGRIAEPSIELNMARVCLALGITVPDAPEELIGIVYDCLEAVRKRGLLPPQAKIRAVKEPE